MANKNINVNGLTIRLALIDDEHYISLTDLARNKSGHPAISTQNRMQRKGTLNFLYTQEKINTPDFKVIKFNDFKGLESVQVKSLENEKSTK